MNIKDLEQEPESLTKSRLVLMLALSGVVPLDQIEALPDPLPVPVTEGRAGPWSIETFTLDEDQAMRGNLLAMVNSMSFLHLTKPGTYTKLTHKERGVVMSNTPMEVRTNMEFIETARGKVAINGLGLGMVVMALLNKPEVESITVFELDPHIIAMVGDYFLMNHADRVKIKQADALTSQPGPKEFYDVVWHDIWDDISDLRIPEMEMLRAKWKNHARTQLFWAEQECHDMKECLDYVQRHRKSP